MGLVHDSASHCKWITFPNSHAGENNKALTQGTEAPCRKEVHFANESSITNKSLLPGSISHGVGDNSSQDDLIPQIPYKGCQGQQNNTPWGSIRVWISFVRTLEVKKVVKSYVHSFRE